MRHHLADMLDRKGDYWTIIPNRERYAYSISELNDHSGEITNVTIGKDDKNWQKIFTFPNIEEVTLHEPTKEQLSKISEMQCIKRLRISHARVTDIEFISPLANIEELIFEYVSGFDDLEPLGKLKKLRALHLENLRKVDDFFGLAGIHSLRYLSIYGTLDWKQPIVDFEFLRGLPNLEVFALWQTINRTPYPALLPAIALKHLKRIKIPNNELQTAEYALLSELFPDVEGADWGAFKVVAHSSVELSRFDTRYYMSDDEIRNNHPEVQIYANGERWIGNCRDEWIQFTGKNTREIKRESKGCEQKCVEFARMYEELREQARAIIKTSR